MSVIVALSLRYRCVIVAPTYLMGLLLPLPHLAQIVPVHLALANDFSHLREAMRVSFELSGV